MYPAPEQLGSRLSWVPSISGFFLLCKGRDEAQYHQLGIGHYLLHALSTL